MSVSLPPTPDAIQTYSHKHPTQDQSWGGLTKLFGRRSAPAPKCEGCKLHGVSASRNGLSKSYMAANSVHIPHCPIVVNVYRLTDADLTGVGIGLYHSGVVVNGKEYSFGRTDDDRTGVFWSTPLSILPNYHCSIHIGCVDQSVVQVEQLIQNLEPFWGGIDYNIITRNCNNFVEELVSILKLPYPTWINRAARWGYWILPESLVEFVMEYVCVPPDEEEEMEGCGLLIWQRDDSEEEEECFSQGQSQID